VPSKRVIRAKDLVRDIRGGMTEAELIQKYRLSYEQLMKLRERLPESGTIEIKAIAADVRSRATDFELCHKYDLSFDELPLILEKLVDIGALRADELKERSAFYDEPAQRQLTRRIPRTRLAFELPVYDADNPSCTGLVRDISERGLRVAGYTPDITKTKRFMVRPEQFPDIRSFDLQVECRWKDKKEASTEYYLAGFEITAISDTSRLEFRKLLRQLRMNGGQIATMILDEPKAHHSKPNADFTSEKRVKRNEPAPAPETNSAGPLNEISRSMDQSNFQVEHISFSEEIGSAAEPVSLATPSSDPLTVVGSLSEQQSVDGHPVRAVERSDLSDFHIPGFEKGNPEILFSIIDITEKGIGVAGLRTAVGETRTLVISASELTGGLPIQFEATCRWVQDGSPDINFRSGFQLANISGEDLLALRELIKLLAILD
jgi:hypothetical protein